MRLILLLLAYVALPASEQPSGLDLYLLIGQSNMAGRGRLDEVPEPAHPAIVMLTKDLSWVPAQDPLHFDKPSAGVGPGLAFARRMVTLRPGNRIGLIPAAVGGTAISVWRPMAEDAATHTHPYDDALRRTRAAQGAGTLRGVLWLQGESDRKDSKGYGDRLQELIANLRRDLGIPGLPWVAGEIVAFKPDKEPGTQAINRELRGLLGVVPAYAVVTSVDMHHIGDQTHFDTPSARLLGHHFADTLTTLLAQP